MVSFTSIVAGLAAAFSFAAAAPTATASTDEVLKISNFFSRKFDGKIISTLGFNISATNGGTLNFACSPYDTVTGKATTDFEDKKVYFCAKDSTFSFSFTTTTSLLYLWQTIVTDTDILIGNATIPNYCHAGGSSATDMACVGTSDVNITMTKTA